MTPPGMGAGYRFLWCGRENAPTPCGVREFSDCFQNS